MICDVCEVGDLVDWGAGWFACTSCNEMKAPEEFTELWVSRLAALKEKDENGRTKFATGFWRRFLIWGRAT